LPPARARIEARSWPAVASRGFRRPRRRPAAAWRETSKSRSFPTVSFPRPLTAAEKAIAWNLLEGAGVVELDVLAEQLEAAQAVSKCECVCPTISMAVDAAQARPTSYSGKPVATADYDSGSVMQTCPIRPG
jgi:hypothetical protein